MLLKIQGNGMLYPEQQARIDIDQMLEDSNWIVREFPLKTGIY